MTKPLKVLIADNSLTMRKFIRGLLEETFELDASQCLEVEDTLKAIEAVKENSFDLITLDLYMLPKSGIYAAQAIREQGVNTPILMITSEINATRLEEARQAGINATLNKPIDPQELQETVQNLLSIGTV
jgi:CheY-like chemotaxis protein